MIPIKSQAEIAVMRKAGLLTAGALHLVRDHLAEGVSTAELDEIACEYIQANGGRPAFRGYRGFPATICASINDVVVHGIPGKSRLKRGDIISIDIGVELNGYYADMAATFGIGEISRRVRDLVKVTEESLARGIAMARIGKKLFDISSAIQRHVEKHGLSVVRAFVGHGIGTHLHEEPEIPNYGTPDTGLPLEEGMVLAIEPMVNAGGPAVVIDADGWTARTADGSLSAHFEHTIAITKKGPLTLTAR